MLGCANLAIVAQIHNKLLRDKQNFLVFRVTMAKMILKVKVNDPHFQYQLRLSQDACMVQIWWFQSKSVMSYQADMPNFNEFSAKTDKMALKVIIDVLHLLYQLRVSHGTCLMQIWWFQPKSVMSYHEDKVNFMDRQRDGRRQWQYPFGLKGQGVKYIDEIDWDST